MRLEIVDDFLCQAVRRRLGGSQHELRVERRFVGVVDTRKTLDLTGAGLLVEPLGVPFLANLQAGLDINFMKLLGANGAGALTIGAVDADRWLNIWADSRFTEDRYIKAVETKPSPDAYRVVHHVATSMRWEGEDGEEGGGFLNEYAMGKNGDIFPEGTGRLIKAGAQIRFNMHYSSVGEEIKDRTRVGFQLYPVGQVPERVLISRHVGDSFDTLDIPAGADNARSDGYYVLPEPTQVTGFQPHMHIRGKRMCVEAIQPNGLIETLSCTGHNFGWHIVYNYDDEEAPLLPAGTILHVIGWHDNTAANRYNPDPKNWVGFGNRSIDDMSFAWMSFFHMPEEAYEKKLTERAKLSSND